MKKKISMSVKTIVYAIAFLAGAYFAFIFGQDWRNYMHPLDMSYLRADNLKANTYVSVNISEYEASTGEFLGVNYLYDYQYFVVKLQENEYIEIGVHEIPLKTELEYFKEDGNETISFIGKVVKRRSSFATEAYEYAGLDPNCVIKGFEIEQTVDNAAMNRCLLAILLTLVSLAGFFGSFKVRYIDEEALAARSDSNAEVGPDGLTRVYNKPAKKKYVNLEHERDIAIRRIERIQKSINRMHGRIFPGILFIIVGAALIAFMREYLILGVVLVLYGISNLWKVFINSGSKLAMTLSEMFGMDTLYRQLKHAEAQYDEIENELGEKAKNDQKIFSSMGRSKDKAIVIDCDSLPKAFMMQIDSDILYSVKHGEEAIHLKVTTDELLHEDEFLIWGNRKKDIGSVLKQASRDVLFIHFDDVDALWLVANDEDYSVAPISAFRLHRNGNVSMENINVGIIYERGEVLDPTQLMLKRAINCLGPVVTTAEYHLNNLVKPQLTETGENYYYIDEEFAEELFAFSNENDINVWIVPVQEDNVDISMEKCNIVKIPAGTKFNRLRVPRRAARSYVDLSLEDGRIARVIEEHRNVDGQDQMIMYDALHEEFTYEAL